MYQDRSNNSKQFPFLTTARLNIEGTYIIDRNIKKHTSNGFREQDEKNTLCDQSRKAKRELKYWKKRKRICKSAFVSVNQLLCLSPNLIFSLCNRTLPYPYPFIFFTALLLMGLKIPVLLQTVFHLGVAHLHLCSVLNT